MSSSNNRLNYLIAKHRRRKQRIKNKMWKTKPKKLQLKKDEK